MTDVKKIYPTLQAMQDAGMLLLVHGEVTHHDVDIFDREKTFLETVLAPIVKDFRSKNRFRAHHHLRRGRLCQPSG